MGIFLFGEVRDKLYSQNMGYFKSIIRVIKNYWVAVSESQ